MIKHTYLRYLLLIACFVPCTSFATGTQNNCIQAVEQALRDEFKKFDQKQFNQTGIDAIIQKKMNTTLKNVMETADACEDNTAKEAVNDRLINIDLKNHTFTFSITVTESNGNNGNDGNDGDDGNNGNEGNEEEHEYDDQTPTGYSSKYYLMFDKTVYDTIYNNHITEITEFQKTTATEIQWSDSCSQHQNPHQHTIKNNKDLNKKIRNSQTQVFGGKSNPNYEYFLNLQHPTRAGFPYNTIGILFYAPDAQQSNRHPVTDPFTDITQTKEIRKKIVQQLKPTSCKGLKIYILEERTNNSDNMKKVYIHPYPTTIQ